MTHEKRRIVRITEDSVCLQYSNKQLSHDDYLKEYYNEHDYIHLTFTRDIVYRLQLLNFFDFIGRIGHISILTFLNNKNFLFMQQILNECMKQKYFNHMMVEFQQCFICVNQLFIEFFQKVRHLKILSGDVHDYFVEHLKTNNGCVVETLWLSTRTGISPEDFPVTLKSLTFGFTIFTEMEYINSLLRRLTCMEVFKLEFCCLLKGEIDLALSSSLVEFDLKNSDVDAFKVNTCDLTFIPKKRHPTLRFIHTEWFTWEYPINYKTSLSYLSNYLNQDVLHYALNFLEKDVNIS